MSRQVPLDETSFIDVSGDQTVERDNGRPLKHNFHDDTHGQEETDMNTNQGSDLVSGCDGTFCRDCCKEDPTGYVHYISLEHGCAYSDSHFFPKAVT